MITPCKLIPLFLSSIFCLSYYICIQFVFLNIIALVPKWIPKSSLVWITHSFTIFHSGQRPPIVYVMCIFFFLYMSAAIDSFILTSNDKLFIAILFTGRDLANILLIYCVVNIFFKFRFVSFIRSGIWNMALYFEIQHINK